MNFSRDRARGGRRLAALGVQLGGAALLALGCQSAGPLALSGVDPGHRPAPMSGDKPTPPAGGILPAGLTVSKKPPILPAVVREEDDRPAELKPPPRSVRQAVASATELPPATDHAGDHPALVGVIPDDGGLEGAIDLEAALRLAGVDNPTVNLARERVREALADQLGARSLLLPSVNIGGNYHAHSGVLQASFGLIRDVNSRSLYLGAGSRTLAAESVAFPGVRLFAHLGDALYEPLAARQRVAARQSDAAAVRNSVLLDVARAYLELVGAEARLAVLRQGQGDVAEVVRLTRAYAEKGQGREADARRAEGNAELVRGEVRLAEGEVAVAGARLAELLNLDPSLRLHSPGGSVEPIRLIGEDLELEALVNQALQNRPEIAARTAMVGEAQTRVRQEQVRPWVPLLSVGFSSGVFGGGGSLVSYAFGPMTGRTDFDVLAVWTFQNMGFGNRARTRRADAIVGEAVADYDAAINQVRDEVAEAQAEARSAAVRIGTARAALANAEEGFRLESDRIKQGEGLPIEVLDNFHQLLEARLELVRAIVEFDVAQFRLFVGVGTNPLAPPPPPPPPPPVPQPPR